MKLINIWNHFKTITKHRMLVCRHCFQIGLYRQGLTHDLSKYSPEEFFTGVRYYQGTRSPNAAEREDLGYSKAWLHHKGRNKHHYEYWIDMREKPDVFMRKYTYHYPKELNIEAMQRAADDLIGRYDFAAFTDKKEEKSTIRTIYAIIVEVQGDKLRIEYRGSGFMYHMVRILTGTLLEVGDGRRTPESVKAALAGRDKIMAAYEEAVKERYRFFSFGDAMFIKKDK